MLRVALLSLVVLTSPGCEDAAPPAALRVRPDPLVAGGAVVLTGHGLGARGQIAVGGRALRILAWRPTRVDAAAPTDLPGGAAWLVVVAEGRPLPALRVQVQGPPHQAAPPRRFGPPPSADGGPSPPLDAGPAPDAGPRLDLRAELFPDPLDPDALRLVARRAPLGELLLEVRLPDRPRPWGAAFHLTYDRDLLRFVRAEEPPPSAGFVAQEIAPGRLVVGRVLAPADPLVALLRFRLMGPGEGRLDFPEAHRALRDAANQPLPGVPFLGGTVRVLARQP